MVMRFLGMVVCGVAAASLFACSPVGNEGERSVTDAVTARAPEVPPRHVVLTCQSSDLGYVEVDLANERPHPSQLNYYAMKAKSFDGPGGIELAAATFGFGGPNLWARISMPHLHAPEVSVSLRTQAFGVDWANPANAEKCYVKAPTPGFYVAFHKETGTTPPHYSEPSLYPYEQNPEVEVRLVFHPGSPFAMPVHFLHGQECERVEGTSVSAPALTCAIKLWE
jgi:hypothetical protein